MIQNDASKKNPKRQKRNGDKKYTNESNINTTNVFTSNVFTKVEYEYTYNI